MDPEAEVLRIYVLDDGKYIATSHATSDADPIVYPYLFPELAINLVDIFAET